MDTAALVVGSIRFASGIQFLVAPLRANRIWGETDPPEHPSHFLLLHSMGYRDALVGGLLASAALRGRDTRGWFLASGGADAADFIGGLKRHSELSRSQKMVGMGGAIVGIGVGLWGSTRRPPKPVEGPAT